MLIVEYKFFKHIFLSDISVENIKLNIHNVLCMLNGTAKTKGKGGVTHVHVIMILTKTVLLRGGKSRQRKHSYTYGSIIILIVFTLIFHCYDISRNFPNSIRIFWPLYCVWLRFRRDWRNRVSLELDALAGII